MAAVTSKHKVETQPSQSEVAPQANVQNLSDSIEKMNKLLNADLHGNQNGVYDGLADMASLENMGNSVNLNSQSVNPLGDRAQQEQIVGGQGSTGGNSGNNGGSNKSTSSNFKDATTEQSNVVDIQNFINNDPNQIVSQGVNQSAEIISFPEQALTSNSREEMLKALELSATYLNEMMQRNPEELKQAHAAVQSAIAMYMLQLIAEMTDTDYEEEEEEKEQAIRTASQELAQFVDNANIEAAKTGTGRKKKKKSKYFENIYEIPLIKTLMKNEAVKRQHVWKLLDKHLEQQISKDEVKEEMFRYSF